MAISRSERLHATELTGTSAIASVAAMIGTLFAGSTVLTPLYVVYQQQMGFSRVMLTLIYATYVCGNLAALFVFGGMSDRLGRRRVALAALAVAIVSVLVFMLADNVASLFIGRILSGLGIGVGVGTGTAWLAELVAGDDKARASTIATSTNFAGLALGALEAGLLAEYAPWPLELPFAIYLVVLVVALALIWQTTETVAHPAATLWVTPRPRLSVPREIRTQFVAPAVTGFGAMALVGFFAALTPSVLSTDLHIKSHAVAGAVFFELAAVVSVCIVLTQTLSSRTAMLWALVLMVPSVIVLVLAQILASMPLMIAAAALCGLAAGLGYRGSLQQVNEIAPSDRRAEVMSAYFVCAFIGNAVPVIGVGVIATFATSATASLAFAATIVVFAIVAFLFELKYGR